MQGGEAIIIGGGQAGLAMSRSLMDRGIEHVVLERGRIAERWRSERWESLRMLTPRWMSRLPGWSYSGPDPDGFMTRNELIDYLSDYARSFCAPIRQGVEVKSVGREGAGYRVITTRGEMWAPNVVIATGHSDQSKVPGFAAALDPRIVQVTPNRYRRADSLPDGGVLVVGASATGVQLAAEIQASGRPVTLAVGRHTRLPRRYRGRDILAWFDAMGVFSENVDQVPNPASSRRAPSLQLVGSDDSHSIDLGTLQESGVRLVGRAVDAADRRVRFANDLSEHVAVANQRLEEQLARVDAHILEYRLNDVPAAEPVRPVPLQETPATMDLDAEGIRSVVWATGFRRSYPWLHVPVLDPEGEIRQRDGVTPAPGLYVLGQYFQTYRNSSLIDGVGRDARRVARHLEHNLARGTVAAA